MSCEWAGLLMQAADRMRKAGRKRCLCIAAVLALFSRLSSVQIRIMNDAQALFETARRIAAVAESEEELATAAGLMRQAAELGHGPAAGAFGIMVMSGQGLNADPDLALRYWTQAALDGADADSAFRLGMACRDGLVCPQDLAGALAWFLLARDLGHDVVLPDIDSIQYEMDEPTRAEAFSLYDHLRENSGHLR